MTNEQKFTASDMARILNVKRPQVARQIKRLGLRPVDRIGNCPLYTTAGLELVREQLNAETLTLWDLVAAA